MRSPTLSELPAAPSGKTGWPWTIETAHEPRLPESQSSSPKISIVLASLNQGKYIEQNIRSVLLQGYPNVEYIIIDGESTDNSIEIIKKYGHWITYWASEHEHNGPGCKSAAEAYIEGFSRATGDVFGITCADDYYAQGAFVNLMRLRASQPGTVIWAGSSHSVDLDDKFIVERPAFIKDLHFFGNWGDDAYFSTVATLMDAKAYRSVGGLDSGVGTSNDNELFLRMAKYAKIALTSTVTASARFNPLSLSNHDSTAHLARMAGVSFMHGDHDVAKRILERYSRDNLMTKPIADILKLRTVQAFVNSIPPAVLVRALFRRVVASIRRRLKRRD